MTFMFKYELKSHYTYGELGKHGKVVKFCIRLSTISVNYIRNIVEIFQETQILTRKLRGGWNIVEIFQEAQILTRKLGGRVVVVVTSLLFR